MKKKILSIAQLVIGIAILSYVFRRMQNRSDLLEAVRDAAVNWPFLVAAVATFGVCIVICTVRWQLLMRALDMRLPFRTVLRLFFIGHFFNSFMFGATGGDFVKAYLATLEVPDKRTAAATSVFIDRLIGLIALVLLVVVMMLTRLSFFLAYPQTRNILIVNAILLVVGVLGLVMVFRRNLFERVTLFRRLEERTSLGQVLGKAYNAFHVCMRHPALLTATIAMSVLNHVMLVVICYFLGRALDVDLPFLDYLTVFPIITAVAAIPITPGGLGTREAMSKWLLGILNIPATRAVPLSLLLYGTMVLWSLVGGLVYVASCYRQAKAGRSIDLEHLREGALNAEAIVPSECDVPTPEAPGPARP